MLSIILLFSYNKMHDFLYVVGYNGNCTSSDECTRGFRCIEMKCSCLDTDTYFDGQEGCKKSILIVFMRKCVCQKYVKTIKSLPWIKTKKFDRIFVNVLVTILIFTRFVEKQYNSSCEHDMQCFEGLVCKGSACVCKINNTTFVHTEKTYGCTHSKLRV